MSQHGALSDQLELWEAVFRQLPQREDTSFRSISGREIKPLYTPLDVWGLRRCRRRRRRGWLP